ncbi:hypothetical protein HHI36_016659 [Cryptolaemus montrouzieri]|uniref:Uncharacterized protein n=1 Tax=Cryptolaemus montrouzieri TaxID=559131 RepID=A0ABD2NKR0_9CUCU
MTFAAAGRKAWLDVSRANTKANKENVRSYLGNEYPGNELMVEALSRDSSFFGTSTSKKTKIGGNNVLKILNFNVQSIVNKTKILTYYANKNCADILCITEHWFQEFQTPFVDSENYEIINLSCRKHYKHGGELIAVKNHIRAVTIQGLENYNYEKDLIFTYHIQIW